MRNLQRDTLRKLSKKNKSPLIPLRIEYSEISKLLTGYVNTLMNTDRIYPTHLPTQANFRWSTLNPPLTNFPRRCINPLCISTEHEWTDECWSLRDILLPDHDEVMVSWDHDNIEGRIGAILLDDKEELDAFAKGYDLHTLTCCTLFNMDFPTNLRNPHTSPEDVDWRAKYHWQGKDSTQRVLAKNFNHGARYASTWRFIYTIMDKLEKYGVSKADATKMAKRYYEQKKSVFDRKVKLMDEIKQRKLARSLYGGRRIFYDRSDDTAKEGFNHMISGTVSDYNNETLILLEERYGEAIRLMHNAHDGNKIALKKSVITDNIKADLAKIVERDISYQGRTIVLKAGIRLYDTHY